jgi:hypothetical protein
VRSKISAAMAAPATAQADRAGFFGLGGGGAAVSGAGDLVNDVINGKADVAAIPAADLPAEIATMPAPARKAKVEANWRERQEVTAEINSLSRERSEYLKRAPGGRSDGFDAKVEAAVKKQAAAVGLKY